jgi:hypothetical protein
MSAHVVFDPSSVNLGIVAPGNTQSLVVGAGAVPSAAHMSVSIVNDNSNGGFHVLALESSILVDVDPGDPDIPVLKGTPHPHGTALKVLASSDGSRPIDVPQGSNVTVAIAFKAPDPQSADSYSATLLIITEAWDPISILMSATSAGIATRVLTPVLSGAQGQKVAAQIEVTSKAGPSTDVSYEMFPASNGITLVPTVVHVERALKTLSSLPFVIDPDAAVGPRQINIVESAFGDEQRDSLTQEITLTVVLGPVVVSLSQGSILQVRPGQTGSILIRIALQGGSTAVTLAPNKTPNGLQVSTQVVEMSAQSAVTVALGFSVDPGAENSIGSPLTITWTAANGVQSGILNLTVNVSPETISLASGPLGPSTVSGSASLVMNSDGFWFFSGHVHESGFIGHDYAFGMTLDTLEPLSGKALVFTNEGTVHGTSDPWGSRDDDWTQQGKDQLISSNWDKIKTSQALATLHVSSDPFQVFEAVVEPLIIAAAAFGAIVFISDSGTHCDPTLVSGENGEASFDMICTRSFPSE